MDEQTKSKMIDQLNTKIEALNKLIIVLDKIGRVELLKKVLRTNDLLSLKTRLLINGVIK
jgi:hypothetical protein